MSLRLLPDVAPWQSWPENREPTSEELESLSDEEYDLYMERMQRVWDRGRVAHPANPSDKSE